MFNITIKDHESETTLSLDDALKELNNAMQRQQVGKALSYAKQIIVQAPKCLTAYNTLYQILSFQQKFLLLEQTALQAIKYNPEHSQSYHVLSNAYRFQRITHKAIEAMEKAVELSPAKTLWLNHLGIMHKELGHFELAVKHFDQCIVQAPRFTMAYWNRSDVNATMRSNDVAYLIALLDDETSFTTKEHVYAAYALFKHFESIENYEKAFSYLTLGASKQRSSFNYNHQIELNEHKGIKQVFSEEFLSQNKTPLIKTKAGAPDDSPIFICGLPRSGTTLAEQIISSHSDVSAGDELFELAQATQNILKKIKPKQAFPFLANELTIEHWQAIGKQYLSLTQHINTKRYFTDKMPLNYKAIGLIHMTLPSAKVVYCQRPPMDLLLGAYKQILDQGNKYTYDLDELTSMIIAHHYVMQHWLKVLPNKIFTLSYQSLINNQEETSRSLLQFLGLAWQDTCLNFHENNRVIHTLSNTQVRKPLFTNSLYAWHKYHDQLKPYANKMQEAGLTI